MTNFEYYKDAILKELSNGHAFECSICRIKHRIKEYNTCDGIKCDKTELFNWGLEEHKEPIKLTKFEYDLLMSYINKGYYFKNYSELKEMRSKGYFKGITDTSMKIQYILNNCEVIE